MSNDSHTTTQTLRPSYAQPSRSSKVAVALVAALMSSTLLCGTLSLFEMRANEPAATTASPKTHPTTDGFAKRPGGSQPRS